MNQNFVNLLSKVNHDDGAKLYHSLNPNKYLYSDTLGWFEYDQWNKLKSYGKYPPSLLNSISKVLKDYILENEALLNRDDEKFVKNKKDCLSAYKWVGTGNNVKNIMEYLTNLYLIEGLEKKLDSNMNLLAFTDCVYDMSIKSFRNINPDDYICKNVGYSKPTSVHQDDTKFIKDVIHSVFENDEIINYWLVTKSLSLFTNKFETVNIDLGSGRNGKGALFNFSNSNW